jgi:LmbE family N-acetylglucosaminyl deacetylase
VLTDDQVDRALAVFAHPDDVDFGAAGTVARWVEAGTKVTYGVVTDGDAGGFDPAVAREEMPRIRRAEQQEAAAELGVSEVVFLGHRDGRLTPSWELRRQITRLIRQVKPQRVLTQSPVRNLDRIYASHPDHLATGEATLCAVYPDARNQFAHPDLVAEGLDPHVVEEVWLMGGPADGRWAGPQGYGMVAVDVTEVVGRKLAALRRHASQMVEIDDLDGMIRDWLGSVAEAAGLPYGRLAEGFRVIDTR